MNQRVMIAMAIACNPRLLIADEPTTALDVTIQAQILDLLRDLQKERGMALVLITHNMGVVSEMAQRIAVMYAGQVMEHQRVDRLFAAAASVHRGAARGAARARRARGAAGHHQRRGAGRARPARGLPVRAALRLRHGACLPGAARRCASGRAQRCAATFRSASRSGRQPSRKTRRGNRRPRCSSEAST
jgi:ABC-type glutathione transport system ATPase component